jgi:hypothetical protein
MFTVGATFSPSRLAPPPFDNESSVPVIARSMTT